MPPASIRPDATPGAKMLYLIKRKPTTSREELVAHWFANHMSGVIEGQLDQKAAGKAHAWRYIATLFDADASGQHPWDGVAQLWWDFALGRPKRPLGTAPKDTFQQKAEPHTSWATTEYVVIDGSAQLAAEPLTLNPPYPTTRSGFHKQTMLVKARDGVDFEAFFAHWLDVHVPNVRETMLCAGGFGYVVSLSIDPAIEPYAGMAELYFPDDAGWSRFREEARPDGFEQWIDPDGSLALPTSTEMIGIP